MKARQRLLSILLALALLPALCLSAAAETEEESDVNLLMAEDIARLLPLLEEKGGVYNVCDTYQPTFGELSASVAKQLGNRKPISIPYWMAWCMAKVGDLLGDKAPINTYKLEKMTKSLTFSNEKARSELGWEPMDVLENFKI